MRAVERGDSMGGDRHKLGDKRRGIVGDTCCVTPAVVLVGSAELKDKDRGLVVSIS